MADTDCLEGPKNQYSDDDLNDKHKINSNLKTKLHIPGRVSPLYNKKTNNMSILTRKLDSINNNKRNQFESNKISDNEELIDNDIDDESEIFNNDITDNISENELKTNEEQHDLSSTNENHITNSDDDENNVDINEDTNKMNKFNIGDKVKMLTNEQNGRSNNCTDTSLLSTSSSLSPSLKSPAIMPNSSLIKPFQSQQIGNSVNPAMAEWYKQYEDRLFNHRNAAVLAAGLHYLKPPALIANNSRLNSPIQQSQHQTQSSPINQNGQTTPNSNDSSLLMERFYSNIPQSANTSSSSGNLSASSPFSSLLKSSTSSSSSLNSINNENPQPDKLLAHQALLAQYAQQFYLGNSSMTPGQQNGAPFNPQMAAAMAVAAAAASGSNHNHTNFMHHGLNPDSIDKERERYLVSLYNQHHSSISPFHHVQSNFVPHPQFNPHFNHQRHQSDSVSPTTPISSSTINQNHIQNHINEVNDRDGIRNCPSNNTNNNNNRTSRRGNSRSPSPTSSQQSGNEYEDDCDDSQSINAANGEWTYEEQFKQLYELSDDAKRKEFLDDLFAFMQKRGSPVNRIPIMAKHVLDLYELYRLVVAKGGLVEVINKKLWREITKGLNLPSSITSAAFTLRTQYMKYLYPYECDKLKLSSPQELQAAIDGNRREGRRPVYGFEYSSPTGMSSSGNSSAPCGSNQNLSNSGGVLGLNKGNLPNELLNGLGHHPGHHPGIHSQHHPHLLPPHHNPFLAAAAAAAAAAAHNSGHHYESQSVSSSESNIHSNHQLPQLSLPPNSHSIPSFLKPFYFEMNTPPSSTSSSSSSSSSINLSSNLNTNNDSEIQQDNQKSSNLENENLNKNVSVSLTQTSSLKRPFDHLDQNSDESKSKQNSNSKQLNCIGNELKEPISKKITLEQSSNCKTALNSNNTQLNNMAIQSNKMKMKILSKETANEILFSDKSISISIELNGLNYQGTLYASGASTSPSSISSSSSSNSSISSSSSTSSSNSCNSSLSLSTPNSNTKFDTNIKTDNIVY